MIFSLTESVAGERQLHAGDAASPGAGTLHEPLQITYIDSFSVIPRPLPTAHLMRVRLYPLRILCGNASSSLICLRQSPPLLNPNVTSRTLHLSPSSKPHPTRRRRRRRRRRRASTSGATTATAFPTGTSPPPARGTPPCARSEPHSQVATRPGPARPGPARPGPARQCAHPAARTRRGTPPAGLIWPAGGNWGTF